MLTNPLRILERTFNAYQQCCSYSDSGKFSSVAGFTERKSDCSIEFSTISSCPQELEIAMSGDFSMDYKGVLHAPFSDRLKIVFSNERALLLRPGCEQPEPIGNAENGFEFLVSMTGSSFQIIPMLLLPAIKHKFLQDFMRNKWQLVESELDCYTIRGVRVDENFLGKWTVTTTVILRRSDFIIHAMQNEMRMNPEDRATNPFMSSIDAYRRLGPEFFERRLRNWKEEAFVSSESLLLSNHKIEMC